MTNDTTIVPCGQDTQKDPQTQELDSNSSVKEDTYDMGD